MPREDRHTIRRDGCGRPPPEGLLRGIEQFNLGEYWECHETLEDIWKEEPEDVRYLYQGILLVAVGLLHLQCHNHHGAFAKLESGLDLLARFEPSCMGVEVVRLRTDASAVYRLLVEGPESMAEARLLPPPQCRLTREHTGFE